MNVIGAVWTVLGAKTFEGTETFESTVGGADAFPPFGVAWPCALVAPARTISGQRAAVPVTSRLMLTNLS